MLIELSQSLINKLGIIVLSAFLLSKSTFFKRYILKKKLTLRDKVLFSFLFGFMGIIGTYSGIPVDDAIANSRSIGVIVAGLFGGPAVGIGAGLIAGIHRMIIPVGRFTAIACGISTILGGVIAGFFKKYVDTKPNKWIFGFLLAILIESLQMLMILLIARPFSQALDLVQLIFLPMTFINAFGTAAFILLIQQIYEENDRIGAVKAQLALSIANQTLPILRNGLTEKSSLAAAKIIYEATGVDAVSFTNTQTILAHVGVGNDHHQVGSHIYTSITKKAMVSKSYIIGQYQADIECSDTTCKLKACIVVPLLVKDHSSFTGDKTY
ncbi:Histidine kinase (fragment) [Petrocella atlantisensis]|uniref:Histidine kinase n=1 Tax=Petrocella atlantisensis TaxID=2173034 RepID=A0A3P7PNW9_9FIRM